MMLSKRSKLFVVAVALAATATPAISAPYEAKCATSFIQYCLQHHPSSPDGMACMYRNLPRLSKPCVDALLEAKLLTREQIKFFYDYLSKRPPQ